MSQPNILLFLTDDHGAWALGANAPPRGGGGAWTGSRNVEGSEEMSTNFTKARNSPVTLSDGRSTPNRFRANDAKSASSAPVDRRPIPAADKHALVSDSGRYASSRRNPQSQRH